jgi:glycosyltransferase involved in cell wall biosynthesis
VAAASPGLLTGIAATSARVGRALRRVAAVHPGEVTLDRGVELWTCDAPERALDELCATFHPDVVIVSSVPRNAWASMRACLRRRGVCSVLYVREAATVEHVPIADLRADLTLVNSTALLESITALGVPAAYVPSMIDFTKCEVESTRTAVLFVNPIRSRGLAIALALAADHPDLPFAFQLSWPLDARDERSLRTQVSPHPNIEVRDHEPDAARVYRDARVLLVPYWVDQRPRVVAEAQWNGIPVLASDLPGHRESVGDGGLFVSLDAGRAAWSAALRTLWDDGPVAQRLAAAARAHATRPEQDTLAVVRSFEALVTAARSKDELR